MAEQQVNSKPKTIVTYYLSWFHCIGNVGVAWLGGSVLGSLTHTDLKARLGLKMHPHGGIFPWLVGWCWLLVWGLNPSLPGPLHRPAWTSPQHVAGSPMSPKPCDLNDQGGNYMLLRLGFRNHMLTFHCILWVTQAHPDSERAGATQGDEQQEVKLLRTTCNLWHSLFMMQQHPPSKESAGRARPKVSQNAAGPLGWDNF